MRSTRRLMLTMILCVVAIGAQGQSIFAPEVTVYTYGLPENAQKELTRLEQQLQTMLDNYAPNVSVEYVPKQPIRISVVLHVAEALGEQYRGSLEVALYRPRFGRDEESLLLLLQEEELHFRFQSQVSAAFIGRDIPTEEVSRMVYYFATLGAMYYYDSFALYGGSPFLSYLQQLRALFETAWQEGQSFSSGRSSRYAPWKHLEELRAEWGDRFRELWYLYHREALDSEVPSNYGETTRVVLQGLKELRALNSSLSFFPLFSDAKAQELHHYLGAEETSTATEVRRLSEELFPSIILGR